MSQLLKVKTRSGYGTCFRVHDTLLWEVLLEHLLHPLSILLTEAQFLSLGVRRRSHSFTGSLYNKIQAFDTAVLSTEVAWNT